MFYSYFLYFSGFVDILLCRIGWILTLIYVFLVLPLLCSLCKKNSDPRCPLPISTLQASSKICSESWGHSTPCPLPTHLIFFKDLLCSMVSLSFLSSTGFVKKCSVFWCPNTSSPLQVSSKIIPALFCPHNLSPMNKF